MKIQKATKKVSEQLELDGVSGINIGQVMSVIIAAERCGLIKNQCPECEQNHESGMNFCAFCGRQLWDQNIGDKDL